MQRSGEYKDCGVASTLSARQYKDATDLVVSNASSYGAISKGNGEVIMTEETHTAISCGGGKQDRVILASYALEPGICAREGGHFYKNVSGTLRANAGDNQMSVAYGFVPGMGAKANGVGWEEEKAPTLATGGVACEGGGTCCQRKRKRTHSKYDAERRGGVKEL